MFENHSYSAIIGAPEASYINALAGKGAVFTASYAVSHPSEPNYLALFSGSTHGITSDQCPTSLHAPNLASDLAAAGFSFAGYSEGLPAPGSFACQAGEYARKHVPWADFSNVRAAANQPFAQFAAGGYAKLPTVSFVIPNLCHDMHDCSVATGDAWLRAHLRGYVSWATTHDLRPALPRAGGDALPDHLDLAPARLDRQRSSGSCGIVQPGGSRDRPGVYRDKESPCRDTRT